MQSFIFLLLFVPMLLQAQLKIGDKMPSIELKNTEGLSVDISSFKGKYVLIDFWASWCAPCRVGNKKLLRLHKELNPNDIEIIGISLDAEPIKWKKAIEKDKLKYLQLIDKKGFDAATALAFGVEELPSKYLFDRQNILIAKNPTEQEIIKLLNKK